MSRRIINVSWWRLGTFSALIIMSQMAAANSLWSKLSKEEQANAIANTKQELATFLRNPKSGIVPLLPNDKDKLDPHFQTLINQLAQPDDKTISQHAGELVAHEYKAVLIATTSWALTELVSSFRDNSLKKFKINSPSRVYLEYLGSLSSIWVAVIKASLDDSNTWEDVSALAWEQLSAQAGKDLQNMQINALEKLLSDAVGSWASFGYVKLLQAEIAYIGEAERLAVIVSADNYYQIYRQQRARSDPEYAFEYTMDYLVGESGWKSIMDGLHRGTARGFRAGGFVLNHVESWSLEQAFERCYRESAPRCRVNVQDLYSKNPGDWQGIRDEMNKTRAQLRLELEQAGGYTRNHLSTVYAHLGELLRKKAYALYQATEAEQAELARRRNDIETLLERLRQVYSKQSDSPELARLRLSAVQTAYAESENALEEAERISTLGRACAKEVVSENLLGLNGYFQAIKTQVYVADSASTAACNYVEPSSIGEAEQIRDKSRSEHEHVQSAARAARAVLAQLARQLVLQDGQTVENPARMELESLLERLEAVSAFSEVREKYGQLSELHGRGKFQVNVAYTWLQKIESLAQPWRGVPDIDAKLDEALRLYGRGPHMDTELSIEGFNAQVSARVAEAATPVRVARRSHPYFSQKKQEGWDALAACKSQAPSERELLTQLDSTEDKLETSIVASQLCLARAQLLVDEFTNSVSHGNNSDGSGGIPDSAGGQTVSPTNTGWQTGSMVETCVTPDKPKLAIQGALGRLHAAVINPENYAELLSAIAALTAAATDPAVCPAQRVAVRTVLEQLQAAQLVQLERAQGATHNALARDRERRVQRAQVWSSAAQALTGLLASLNNAAGAGANRGTGWSGLTAGAQPIAGTQPTDVPNNNSGECAAMQSALQRKVSEWQSLLTRRPVNDKDGRWCRQAISWQRQFSAKLQEAERKKCVEIHGNNAATLLRNSRSQLAAFSCSASN